MDLKQKRILLYALAVIATLTVFLIGTQLENKAAALLAVAAILVIYVIISQRLWRCPHCGAYLGRLYDKHSFCQECGGKLDDLD